MVVLAPPVRSSDTKTQLTLLTARKTNPLRLRRSPSLRLPSRREAIHRPNVSHLQSPFPKKQKKKKENKTLHTINNNKRLICSPSLPLPSFEAGRGTGLDYSYSFRSEGVSESKEVRKWLDNYLWVGEVVMDQGVALMSASSFFERKR